MAAGNPHAGSTPTQGPAPSTGWTQAGGGPGSHSTAAHHLPGDTRLLFLEAVNNRQELLPRAGWTDTLKGSDRVASLKTLFRGPWRGRPVGVLWVACRRVCLPLGNYIPFSQKEENKS